MRRIATAQIGRRLRIPVRTSAVNASPAVDAQSTYETAFSLQAAILSHSHLINHAAGWLEGGLVASLEKIVVDAEMLRCWAEILRPVSFTDDDLAVDAIKGVEAGGHFFGAPHTLARFETAFYRPLLSDWSNFESWTEAGARDATQRATDVWKKRLAEYTPPPLDPAVREAIIEYVARRAATLGHERRNGAGCAADDDHGDHECADVLGDARGRGAWRELLAHVTDEAGVPLEYVPTPRRSRWRHLWARPDLGCVFMCGYPVALQLAAVVPIAAPMPAAPWAAGRPLYRSRPDRARGVAVRARSRTRSAAAPAGRSSIRIPGFNAFRHHLLQYRTAARPQLYREMVPNLVTARAILDAVREGRIDVGPLDAYWHLLVAKHAPALVEGVRVLESTDTATLPAFVAAASTPATTVDALRAAFAGAAAQPWFGELADALLIDGFAAVDAADYARTLEWDRQGAGGGLPQAGVKPRPGRIAPSLALAAAEPGRADAAAGRAA